MPTTSEPNTTTESDTPNGSSIISISDLEVTPVGASRPAFILTKDGIIIPDDLTEEEWVRGLGYFKDGKERIDMAFAQYLAFGALKFTKEKADKYLGQLEFDLPTVTKALNINSVPPEVRHPNLGADHYVVIGKAKLNRKEQTKWAQVAAEQHLSPSQLKASIEAGEVIGPEAARQRQTGIISIHGLRQEFDIWMRRVGGLEGILKQPKENQEEIIHEIAPFAQLHYALLHPPKAPKKTAKKATKKAAKKKAKK